MSMMGWRLRAALAGLLLLGPVTAHAQDGAQAAAVPAASVPDGSRLRLDDGFESGGFAPGGGLFYKKNREQGAGTVNFQAAVVRDGRKALELTVRPQCKTTGNTLCSERAEVWERPEVLALYDQTVWYAFSMMLDRPVPKVRHRYVMAQWKREIKPGADGDYSPLLALRLIDGRIAVTIDTDTGTYAPIGTTERPTACKPGEIAAAPPDKFGQFRALAATEPTAPDAAHDGFPGCSPDVRVTARGGSLPAAGSGWIDFVFMVKPGPHGNGHIEIVANDAWIATVEGHIGHDGPGLDQHQYFKFGPYRAGASDIWRIYYDDFRRGPACTDVASEALCAKIGAGTTLATP